MCNQSSIIIAGCPLPSIGEDGLRKLCLGWEKNLQPRISPSQLAYLRCFAANRAALRSRVSRLLARLAAAKFSPQTKLPDPAWLEKSQSPGSCAISYSHSGLAAFALIYFPGGKAEYSWLAIDAENIQPGGNEDAYRQFFQKSGALDSESFKKNDINWLRLWTIYEALAKSGDAARAKVKIRLARKNRGLALVNGERVRWLSLPFMGHWLCLAGKNAIPDRIIFRWLHPLQLSGNKSNFL